MARKTTSAYLLGKFDCDALKGTFKYVTIKRACFRWCGMMQYSALVNSVFNNKCNTFFGLNLTLVYTFPMSMAWRFHFPLRKYDFNILISATSSFFSCALFTAQVSAPYIIAGITTVLYTFPLTLKLILRWHRIVVIIMIAIIIIISSHGKQRVEVVVVSHEYVTRLALSRVTTEMT